MKEILYKIYRRAFLTTQYFDMLCIEDTGGVIFLYYPSTAKNNKIISLAEYLRKQNE